MSGFERGNAKAALKPHGREVACPDGTGDGMKSGYTQLFARQTPVRGKYFEQAARAEQQVVRHVRSGVVD